MQLHEIRIIIMKAGGGNSLYNSCDTAGVVHGIYWLSSDVALGQTLFILQEIAIRSIFLLLSITLAI